MSEGVHTSSPQQQAMALEAEEERKHIRSWDQPARIRKIKSSLEEVIATIDSKEAETRQMLGHLTAAYKAMERACCILPDSELMQKTLTTSPRPKHQVTMVERSILFHQWQAQQSNPTCSTSEPRLSCQTSARRQR